MSGNAQLGRMEAPVVYIEAITGRILGFGRGGDKPQFPSTTKFRAEKLYHVSDIDKYMNQFRQQWRTEQELKIYNQIASEKPTRDRIKELIRSRNPHVDQRNRDQNEAAIRLMDARYEATMKSKLRQEVTLTAERWDASKFQEDIATSDPGFSKVRKIEAEAQGAIVRRSKEG